MALPSTVTTNLFPDFKNSPIGPFPRIVQEVQDTSDSSGAGITGSTVSGVVKAAQSFQTATAGELVSADLYLGENGTPTDALSVGLYSDNAGVPGTLLASGTNITAARIAGNGYYRSTFFLPQTLATSTTYWLVAQRTGSADTTNSYSWFGHSGAPYANGAVKTFGTIWGSNTFDLRFKFNIRTAGRYLVSVDKTNNKARMFKSTDGQTWTEQDSANAPATSTTANTKSVSAIAADTLIPVFLATSTTQFKIFRFDTGSDTWGTVFSTNSSVAMNTNASSNAPALGSYHNSAASAFDYFTMFNGATETVMGNARRRIKIKTRSVSGGAWQGSPGVDLVGSPNTPDITTLPGTAVDYDARAEIMDGNNVWHGFWTQSDDSNVHHRQFNENDTFSTANLLGSTAAVTSNSAAYSIGRPANYYRSDEWYIALPYTDAGAIKVSTVKASLAATASNWTNTTAVASGAETTNSNPAVLIADNEQGGKLFLIFPKTDGKLYITHDSGSGTWVAEQELHAGTKTVAGLSAGLLFDIIGIAYLDTSPTPDEIRYDQIDVFF